MIGTLRKVVSRITGGEKKNIAHGPRGIRQLGHRAYVGAAWKWEILSSLQFDFLIERGLKPETVLIDIGCGSLRAGIRLIPYLNRGCYLGLEKEAGLVEAGIREELGLGLLVEKHPEFVVSDQFEFDRFSKRPQMAIAQSVFTHMPPAMVEMCMRNLRAFAADGCCFYATYFECEEPASNLTKPHDHRDFFYTRDEMERFGKSNGWSVNYIGDWNHPAGQVIVEYVAESEHQS